MTLTTTVDSTEGNRYCYTSYILLHLAAILLV